ncbi:MAG: tyrosine-type recombinase/integrase [Candidatus Geothermincolia bacterium]
MSTYIRTKDLPSGKRRFYVTAVIAGHHYGCGGFKVKKDAEARRRLIDGQIATGAFRKEPVKITEAPHLSDFAETWLQEKDMSLKPSSARSYRDSFKLYILPALGSKRLDEITPTDVQNLINQLTEIPRAKDKKLGPSSIQKCYRSLRACLNQAVNRDMIDRSPCRGISLPKLPSEELEYLTPSETMQLLEATGGVYRDLFTVLAYSGLRLGEGLALRWRDVDFDMNMIRVNRSLCSLSRRFLEPKTKSSRRAVPMLSRLRVYLSEMRDDQAPDDLLFTSANGNPLDSSNCSKAFETALEAAGLKHVTIHSLRHTYASTRLAAGASIKRLQQELGHASVTMTLNVYSHLIPEGSGEDLARTDALFGGPETGLIELRRAE